MGTESHQMEAGSLHGGEGQGPTWPRGLRPRWAQGLPALAALSLGKKEPGGGTLHSLLMMDKDVRALSHRRPEPIISF